MAESPVNVGLIVAAGIGARAGGDIPKQYQKLGSEMVLTRTIRSLLASAAINRVVVVVDRKMSDFYDQAVNSIADPRLAPPVSGGDSRRASVLAGLRSLEGDEPDRVLIHDAARPFVTPQVIDRVLAKLEHYPAAFAALPVVDALWRTENGQVTSATPREDLWRAQTPQGFHFDRILKAHLAHEGPASDDVAVAHGAGMEVAVVPGDGNNFKITLPQDFERAKKLLETPMDVRTGQGFDVHAFDPGDHVTLCGIEIPFEKTLAGHSDADVAMHAITDALFGALAEGDIGRWFPPTEAAWKGAASHIFLEKAVERVAARGYRISNIDCTIICERPKVGPLADAMQARIAEITGIAPDRVGIKATTSEKLGFTGRGEGIAAMASATLVSP